jgi:hypothetical protein
VSIGSGAHECWDEDSGNDPTGLYTDNSEQYIVSTKSSATWMYKGASGSPVLNTDFQVVGIYWGGFGPKDGTTFNPCISAFSWVWTWNSNENEKYLRT